MSDTAVNAGKAFLAGVLAKISDPEKRAQVEATFNDPANKDALVVVGSGALAQSDINKKYTDLQAEEAKLKDLQATVDSDFQKLNAWYEPRQADFAIVDKLKAEGKWKDGPVADPLAPHKPTEGIDPSKYLSLEDFNKQMQGQQMAAANVMALMSRLTLQHRDRFGEILDASELLSDPNLGKNGYGLIDAYQTKFKDKLTEYSTNQENARVNKLVEERLAEERKKNPGLTVPLRSPIGASPLDYLDGSMKAPEGNLAELAAAEYDRLQQAKVSST